MKLLTHFFTAIWLTGLVLLTVLLGLEVVPQDKVYVVLIGLTIGFIADSLIRSVRSAQRLDQIGEVLKKIGDHLPPSDVSLIKEPNFDETWVNYRDHMDVFNAPWSLASDKILHVVDFYLRSRRMPVRVLTFEGDTEAARAIATARRKRMKACLAELSKKHAPVKGLITVRHVNEASLPGSSFFISKGRHDHIALLYVYPFISGDLPEFALEICRGDIVRQLRREFDLYWAKGQEISLDELLAES